VETQDKIVLLVENDLDLRRAMCLLLEKWGISVLDVKDGEEAVSLLDEIGIIPDAMLVDFQLGDGMNGVELIRKLYATYGPVPARIITADRSIAIRALCKRDKIEIMHKPLDASTLETYLYGLVT
jgi:two-component system, sensor histidine kinase